MPADLIPVRDALPAALTGLAPGSSAAREAQTAAAAQLGWPLEARAQQTGILFRFIPPGTFTMGSPAAEQDAIVAAGYERQFVAAEGPPHQVTLTQPFYCGKYPITQQQWQAVMGSNPAYFQHAGGDAPVESVSWDDCQAFLRRLCAIEGVPAGSYRLLTEAEREYACRAGTSTALYSGEFVIAGINNVPALDAIAWYGGNSGVAYDGAVDSASWPAKQHPHAHAGTHPVGQRLPNAYGLYDLLGNVWQWCQDRYGAYPAGPVVDPQGPSTGGDRVNRGGCWNGFVYRCRAAARAAEAPGFRAAFIGLRVARVFPAPAAARAAPPPAALQFWQDALAISGLSGTLRAAPADATTYDLTLVPATASLAPLRHFASLPLHRLEISGTQVTDLAPLAGLYLLQLQAAQLHLPTLAPLRGLPLTALDLTDTDVMDISDLAACTHLQVLTLPKSPRRLPFLPQLPALTTINGQPAAQYWAAQPPAP